MEMSEKIVETVPDWLGELEAKRERRLKVRLGHEAGAGAPCLQCDTKCPGLDLHFWRKICKNCKCSKENHDVHDDDIYGWAQFQLLGSRPNKMKRKIKLPGGKDEVELDWTPKGQQDTIDKYLETLPTDQLPVKGSQAAQHRKQLLQKQIPMHDIDPTLCHDLTEAELTKMHDYIQHMKANSVGVGHVVQMGLPLPTKAKLLMQRCSKALSAIETVSLQSGNIATILKGVGEMTLANNNAEFKTADNLAGLDKKNLPHYVPAKLNILNENQTPTKMANIKDFAFGTFELAPSSNNNLGDNKRHLTALKPSNFKVPETNLQPNPVNIGLIKDISYNNPQIPNDNNAICHQIDIPNDDNAICELNDGTQVTVVSNCWRCQKQLKSNEFAVFVDRNGSIYHSECFKCAGCNQNLADMVYFYDKDSNDVYCGRDYAKIRGIPRCRACDELIFLKEYCLAENSTFHVKHFCCFECDGALAGQNYVVDDDGQTLCLPCFENLKANNCNTCQKIIKPDEQGANLNGIHFHANNSCFMCCICKTALLSAKFLLKEQKLFCSHRCFQARPLLH